MRTVCSLCGLALLAAAFAVAMSPAQARGDDKAAAANPQYSYWSKYKPGSSVTMSGEAQNGEQKMTLQMKATLSEVTKDAVTLEKVITINIAGQDHAQPPHKEVVKAVADGPDPKQVGEEELTIAGKALKCKIYEVQTPVGGGQTTPTRVWVSDQVPGGAVKMTVKTPTGSATFTVKSYEIK